MNAPARRRAPLVPPLSPARYAALYALRKAASTQTAQTVAWLQERAVALTAGRSDCRLLSLGTGEGDVDLALLDALEQAGARPHLTALEPSAAQRRRLARRLAVRAGRARVEVVPETFERFAASGPWDLVLICQSAYYLDPPTLADQLHRAWSLVDRGGSLVVAHQSARGVPEVQARHLLALRGAFENMLDGDALDRILAADPRLPYRAERDRHVLDATLDLRDCLDPGSRVGCDILSFCLECELGAAPARAQAAVRRTVAELAELRGGRPVLVEPVDVFWLRRRG